MRRYINPLVVAGALGSILVALVLFILGMSDAHSTIIALLGIAITFQIDQITRTEEAVVRTSTMATLWTKMSVFPWLQGTVTNILESTHTIASGPEDEVFTENARAKLEDCRRYLEELSSGRLRTVYQDVHLMLRATGNTKRSIRAVSVASPKTGYGWWSTQIGRNYWSSNLDARKRGVEIERIFVYNEFSSELQSIVAEQHAADIVIYLLPAERIAPAARINSILFDETFLYELHLSSDGEPIEHLFSANPEDIRRKESAFTSLRDVAERYTPP